MVVRRGDLVRVRSREEILATLDRNGAVEELPFMPEMLKYCGQELTVYSSAHKTCDTVDKLGKLRQLNRAVHLEGARCDGSAHGGCQAACMLFFREEWLEGPGLAEAEQPSDPPLATVETLAEATHDGDVYHCQATAMRQASTPLPSHHLGQYVTDYRSRNVGVLTLIKGILISIFNLFQWQARRRVSRKYLPFNGEPYPFVVGEGDGKRRPSGDIQPGDLVEIRSKNEILSTLNPSLKNGGMLFDGEMLPFCGQQARVERKVDQIIDEPSGKMIKLHDCLVLENLVCQGVYHRFCPKAGLPYWREAWLRKVDEPAEITSPS